jgi:hypothetical protein
LEKEAMAADVEAKAVVLHRAAYAAHIMGVLFDHGDLVPAFGQEIRGGKARRPGADDRYISAMVAERHSIPPIAVVLSTECNKLAKESLIQLHAGTPVHRRACPE